MRHSVSRWDHVRLTRLQAQLGELPDRSLLWVADGLRLGGAYPGRLISDAMVAIWAADASVRARFPELGRAATQRALLAWYCCETAGSERETTLRAAAAWRLAASDDPALPLTGLIDIAAAHCFPGGGAPPLRGPDNLIAWFYRTGAAAAGVSHHVGAQEQARLRAAGMDCGTMPFAADAAAAGPGARARSRRRAADAP